MPISSWVEEPTAVDAEGPGERWQRRRDPPEEELPPTPPAGAEHHDFGIASGIGEEEGLGEVRDREAERGVTRGKGVAALCFAGARIIYPWPG